MSSSEVDMNVGQSSDMSNCPFCGIGGVSWLEYHLAGTTPCSLAFSTVKQQGDEKKVEEKDVIYNLPSLHSGMGQIHPKLSTTPASETRKRLKRESPSNGNGSITSTDEFWLIEAKQTICSFFHENGIDFGVVKSPSFRKMASLVFGPNVQIPACDKLQSWILETEMKDVGNYLNEVRSSWAETGSSILIDGWANAEGRNFISFFVDCPKGTIYLRSFDVSDFHGDLEAMKLLFEQVIEEVGSNNVVQIVTYSTSTFIKEIGEQLMEKYRSIVWTVDSSFCINLMIEKYGSIVSDMLGKAKIITRFVYNHQQVLRLIKERAKGEGLVARSKTKLGLSFFTLENIASKEKILKEIFLSSDSQTAVLTSTTEGQRVAALVGDKSFWANAKVVLTAVIPLVRAMELMNERRSHMDCIYETMDQVKETIKKGFAKKKHVQFWNAIDAVWCDHLYNPIHSAGYFLNPTIFYSEDVCIDKEVSVGLFQCVSRMAENHRVVGLITDQLVLYQKPGGSFAVGCAEEKRSIISPVEWWSRYGGQCPELQKFAIRILSQTCSGASRLQLERSLVENLFKRGMNQIELEKLSQIVFMRYNTQLSDFASGSGSSNRMVSDGVIDPVWLRDWTVGNARA